MITIAEIRNDGNTTDEFYKAEKAFYDANTPVLQSLVVAYQNKMMQTKFRPELEAKIGRVAFRNMEIAAKAMDDSLIPLMQEENTLVTQYENLLASAKIDWNGEKLNLSLMNPYLRNADRRIRAEACAAAAYILMKTNRKFGFAAVFFAAAVIFSRLYLFVHFPSDVLAGAILGIVLAAFSWKYGMPLLARFSCNSHQSRV